MSSPALPIERPPNKAPLSGPLVIAERLGERTVGYSKPAKAKDSPKKGKYQFKRRDEPVIHIPKSKQDHQLGQPKSDVLLTRATSRATGDFAGGVGDYVFQKGIPSLEDNQPIQQTKQEQKTQIREETGPFTGIGIREPADAKPDSVDVPGNVVQITVPARQPSGDAAVQFGFGVTFSGQEFDKVRNAFVQDVTVKKGLEEDAGCMSRDGFVLPEKSETGTVYAAGESVSEPFKPDDAVVADSKDSEKVNLSVVAEQNLVEIPANVFVKPVEQDQGIDGSGSRTFSESPGTIPVYVANLSGDIPGKTLIDGSEMLFEDREIAKRVKARAPKRPWKESSPETAVMKEKKKKKKKMEGSSVSTGAQLTDATGKIELTLPELVSDMLALALDPYYGYERNRAATVRQVFLRFRSLVYQKSLVLPLASELDTVEHVVGSSISERMQSEYGVSNAEEPNIPQTKLKSVKPVSKSGSSEKLARKWSHSDQQDEVSAKRQKKLKELKSMALVKHSGQKAQQDGQRGDRKETVSVPAKTMKPDSGRKPEPSPAIVAQPMILIMKFPPGTSIPSMPQLKARFARFGPLELSGTRVFYRTSTCRVVFKHKSDAKAAYEHATRNFLFGQTRVVYHLKEIHVPAPEPPESGKRRVDDAGIEARQSLQHQQWPAVQLKSCLKKQVSDDSGAGSGLTDAMKESPRVKFLLGGGEKEQLVSGSTINMACGADRPSTAVGILFDVNKKVKMVIPPLVPLQHGTGAHETARTAANFSKDQPNFSDVGGRKNVDISHQLLSLLMRLNEVVSGVKCALGYVPYHPL